MRVVKLSGGVIVAALTLACPVKAQEGYRDTNIKASYIFHFTRLIEVPSANARSICVIDSDLMGTSLAYIKESENKDLPYTIHSKSITSERFDECIVLYVSRSQRQHLRMLFLKLNHVPLITISDIDDFVSKGGIIGFVKKKNRVVFQINKTRSDKLKIKISSRLLQLAEKIK